jgi:hypothetical protein
MAGDRVLSLRRTGGLLSPLEERNPFRTDSPDCAIIVSDEPANILSVRSTLELIEPLAFFTAVMTGIWIFWDILEIAIIALAIWVIAYWFQHGQIRASLGFSTRATLECLSRWRFIWLLLLLLAVLILRTSALSTEAMWRGARYWGWCIAQQAIYQTMIFDRLRGRFNENGLRQSSPVHCLVLSISRIRYWYQPRLRGALHLA